MDIYIEKGERDERFQELRSEYLDSLCQPIELYSEIMCRDASPFFIFLENEISGYSLVGDKGILLELHLIDRHLPMSEKIFDGILDQLEIKKVICQSWDHLLMSLCMTRFKDQNIVGYNFRDRIEPKVPIPKFDLLERPATQDDVELFIKYSDGLFEEDEIKDIPYWIDRSTCIIFEDRSGKFIGYGMINRSIDGRDWHDIGMYVKPELRKKGFGAYIIDRLARICDENGWRPTAGCDKKNIGSKKTLEKAGFVSKYIMVEFSV